MEGAFTYDGQGQAAVEGLKDIGGQVDGGLVRRRRVLPSAAP